MIRAIQSGAALLSKFFEDPKQVLQGMGFKKTYLRDQKITNQFSCAGAVFWPFVVFESPGPPVLSLGPLVPWSSGLWSLGPPVPWSLGPPVPWSSGPWVLPSFDDSSALKHFYDNPYFNQP